MATKKKTTPTKFAKKYPLFGSGADMTNFSEVMEENLGGEELNAGDIPRISIPAAGGKNWEMPDGTATQSFDAVIVAHRQVRTYWESEEPEEGVQPDCWSDDGKVGHGTPGGPCAKCSLAQFGSDARGIGQACSLKKELYLIMPGQIMPVRLTVPPSSLRAVKTYMINLVTMRRKYALVETKFSLKTAKSKSGISYSQLVLSVAGMIDGKDADSVKAVTEGWRPMLLAPRQTQQIAETSEVEDEVPF